MGHSLRAQGRHGTATERAIALLVVMLPGLHLSRVEDDDDWRAEGHRQMREAS